MFPPLISVIIPTYNRGALIKSSIESVEKQTFQDFEIIVVDDGSTDDTEQVIAELGQHRIRYIRHDKNRGANVARNTGIQEAKGEYIAFQDSDDTWHPKKLAKQVDACNTSGADVAFCAFNRVISGKKTYIPKPGYKLKVGYHNFYASLLRGSFISCQTLFIRRPLLLEVGMFDEELPRLQDWELCLRLSENHSFVFLSEPLVEVEIRADSISTDTKNYARAADLILKKHDVAFAQDKIAAAILCIGVAAEALRSREPILFLKYLVKAIRRGSSKLPCSLAILARRG